MANLGLEMIQKVRVHVVLVLVQVGYAFFQLLTKVAFKQGLNKTTYPIYRNAIGFLLILPFAAHYERKERPNLTFSHLAHFFFLGLTAVALGQGLFLFGLYDTSPTFASAFQNSIPALTFALAAGTGVEDLNLRNVHGQAKLLGAISAGAGATIMTAYKGRILIAGHEELHQHEVLHEVVLRGLNLSPWHMGSLYLIISCLAFAGFYVLQAKTLKAYPARLSTVCFTNMFGAMQLSLFALVSQPGDFSAWKVPPGLPLASILYAGLVASGLVFSAQAWSMQKAGPVVVSAYQPLQTVVVGLVSVLFLGETLYVGSIVGALLIVGGLYLVIWGQEKHQQLVSRHNSVESATPLLPENGVNV